MTCCLGTTIRMFSRINIRISIATIIAMDFYLTKVLSSNSNHNNKTLIAYLKALKSSIYCSNSYCSNRSCNQNQLVCKYPINTHDQRHITQTPINNNTHNHRRSKNHHLLASLKHCSYQVISIA